VAIRRRGKVSHDFSGLISMFVLDISYIPSAFVQICSGSTATLAPPPGYRSVYYFFLVPVTNHDSEVT